MHKRIQCISLECVHIVEIQLPWHPLSFTCQQPPGYYTGVRILPHFLRSRSPALFLSFIITGMVTNMHYTKPMHFGSKNPIDNENVHIDIIMDKCSKHFT